MASTSKINFKAWLILFALLLAAVPAMIYMNQRNLAKGIGFVTLLLTVFAIRRWMYVIRKRSKVGLNLNDRFWLNEHIPFYASLSKSEKKIFEDRVALFISEIVVTELGKDVPDRETCLYVAASAVISFWGFPHWNFGRLEEVIISRNHAGEDHTNDQSVTTMTFFYPLLLTGIKNESEKQGDFPLSNSLLDKSSHEINTLSYGISLELRLKWISLLERELKFEMRNSNDMDTYLASGPIEFFAVLLAFYQNSPELFHNQHKEMYEFLSDLFSKESKE